MWPIFNYPDIHSHVPGPGRVHSIDFTDIDDVKSVSGPFTLGIHPWNSNKQIDWDAFERCLEHPDIVGIGEAGLDSLRGPMLDIQLPVFLRQIELSGQHNLPLVIHSVRNNSRILQLKKKYRPTVPWIIHGFAGKPMEAQQLIDAGIHLSLGKRSNPDVAAIKSPFIHYESDDESQ